MLTRVHLVRVRAGARARARVGVKVSLVEVRRDDLGFRTVRPGASSSTARTGYAHRPPAYRTCLRRRAACPGGPLLCVRRTRTRASAVPCVRVPCTVWCTACSHTVRPTCAGPQHRRRPPTRAYHCTATVRASFACQGLGLGRTCVPRAEAPQGVYVRTRPPVHTLTRAYHCTTAGKTTILYKLQMGEVVTTVPTIGLPHRARTSDQQTLGGPATHTSEPQVCWSAEVCLSRRGLLLTRLSLALDRLQRGNSAV